MQKSTICMKIMLQLLFQRLNLSNFFLHFSITLRGIRCLSNLCGQECLLNAYRTSLLLICGDCLKVYRLQKIETLALRLHSCRRALICGSMLAASAMHFSGASPGFSLKMYTSPLMAFKFSFLCINVPLSSFANVDAPLA